MTAGETFQVDPEAAAAAKESGDYGTGEEKTEGVSEEEKPAVISDEDPGEDGASTTDEEIKDDKEKSEETKEGEEEKKEGEDTEADEASTKFSESAEKWTSEFMESGELSEETQQEIAESVFAPGVPKEVVAEYMATYTKGLQALGNVATQAAFDIVGGAENYASMTKWASDNLTADEIAAFDVDATGTDVVRRDAAIQGLHARMQVASGSEPDNEPNLSHDGGRGVGEPIIGSRQELAKIMATEAYQKDPAVRAKVENQLRQSKKTGKYRTS